MKRAIIFVILAVALIGGGVWYNDRLAKQEQQMELDQAAAAREEQAKIMRNFKIEDITIGTGDEAKNGDSATVNYVGTLDDGKKFDSNIDPAFKHVQPFTFGLGKGEVIKGWDLGVLGMKVGGKRNLTIPPELGYGPNGSPPVIPPNATLHFTVELLSVKSGS